MRIAIVGANQQVVGGAETYLAWLLATLVARGHDVAFAFETPAQDPERAADRGLDALVRWDLSTTDRNAFFDQMAAFRPDVVFLQGCRDDAIDRALAARFRALLFAHSFYATCATGWRVHRIPERRICARRFGAACLPINFLRGCGARNPRVLLNLYSGQRRRVAVLHGLVGLVVASEYMRQVYLQHGVPENEIHVVPYPSERLPDKTPPALAGSLSHVLFLGRLTSGKGGVRAVQAAARCQHLLRRPLRLTIAGEGPERARCERAALRLGLQTQFTGWVGPEQRLELLRDSDVLVVPSLWPEPFGIVGLEAAAVGVPAVAYAAGGIVDWLRPGETGELARGLGFDAKELAAALSRVLGDAEHHRKLQLGAWRMAHEFSSDRHVSEIEALFQRIASSA